MVVTRMNALRTIPILTIIMGLMGWILTFSVDPKTSPFAFAWQVTLIANPIGVLVSYFLYRNKIQNTLLFLFLNLILTISLGPMWFLTDLLNLLTGN